MGKKILLADDKPDITKLIKARLSKAGYEVVVAANGQEALEFIRQHPPDLIILDYRMPILNGVEVCQRVKDDEALKHIPIIFMTGSPEAVTPNVFEEVQKANDYVIKPFEAKELLEKVKRLVG